MNQPKRYDMIIVGGGIIGAFTLFELTRRGYSRVLLLEKNSAMARGATGAWGSFVRIYHQSQKVSKLAVDAVSMHLSLRDQHGIATSFNNSGSLYFLKASRLLEVQKQLQTLNRGSLQLSIILADEGRKNFSSFQWSDDDFAIYESHSGTSCPWTITDSLIEESVKKGARTLNNFTISGFAKSGEKIIGVQSSEGEVFLAEKIVICAGPATPGFMAELGEADPTWNEMIQVNHFHRNILPKKDPFFIDGVYSTFGRPGPEGSFLGGYLVDRGIPVGQNSDVKISMHESAEAKRRLSYRVSWMRSSALKGGVRALENYSENGDGFVRQSERYPNVFISGGWSCSGFTLAPVVSKQISDLVVASGRSQFKWTVAELQS